MKNLKMIYVSTKNIVLQKFKYFYKRFISLWTYVQEIPILHFSLFSFFITFLSFEIYEAISINRKNGKFFILFTLILSLSILVFVWKFSQRKHRIQKGAHIDVQILFFALIL
jgi:hypothetical protein